MANIQKYFEKFHDVIRTDYEMNSDLREKRDIVVKLVKKYLNEQGHPACEEILQGSYRVGTGIKPIENLEYDIDVGLRFCFRDSEYSAKDVRSWVFKSVDGHTDSVAEMGPCIRVNYAKGFHIDLVAYATWAENGEDQYRLAHKKDGWRPANPPAMLAFVKKVRAPFEGTEDKRTSTDQFRRVVRYLKRWNDEAIPTEEEFKASGLALLLLTAQYLSATKFWDGTPDDLTAIENVSNMAGNLLGRISVKKPTPEYEDLFSRIDDDQMAELKERFKKLGAAASSSRGEVDVVKACKTMRSVLGRDFPVPEPEETAKKTSAPAIVTSSSSAKR